MNFNISRKHWRIFKKACSLLLALTFFTTTVIPIEILAADSANYRLSTFIIDNGDAPVASVGYDLKYNTFGESVNGDSESQNTIAKTGFLHTITKDPLSPPPPQPGSDYLAESANFRQTSFVLSMGFADASSANFNMPLSTVGEPAGGVSEGHYNDSFVGYIYTIQGNAPVLTNEIPAQSWAMNTDKNNAFDLDDYFMDTDGDNLSFTVTGNNRIAVAIDPLTHLVNLTPDAGFTGSEDIIITARDPDGNTASSNPVTLNVYNTIPGINNPPVLEFIPDITVKEGQLISITPSAFDPDGDTVTYSFSAPFDSEGKWQTDYQSSGTYNVMVTASDDILSDSQQVKVTVLNVNRKPVLNFIADINGQENQLITITPSATDPDGDALTYSFSPPFNAQGQWLPTYQDSGAHTMTVTVSDGSLTDSQDVHVNVSNVNATPKVRISLDRINAAVNETITFIVSVSDADYDSLQLIMEKDGSQFYSGNVYAFYLGSTSFSSLGTHTIKAIVDDGNGGRAETTVNVEIIDPPSLWNKILPLLGDFNGDGIVDIGTYNRTSGRWAVALSSQEGFGSITEWLAGFGSSTDWQYVNGDFNGDGKTDIAVFNQTSGQWQVGLSDGARFTDAGVWSTFSGASTSSIPITGDFNGDGISDVGIYNRSNGEVRCALSDKSAFQTVATWLGSFASSGSAQPFGGDFNGDGLTDFGVFNDGNWSFAVSNGAGFIAKSDWAISFGSGKSPVISDFNHDGLTDIGIFEKDSGRWLIYRNTGNGFVSAGEWLNNFGQGEYNSVYALDFNGDGLTDAAAFDNSNFTWQRKASQGKVADLLQKITNGLGGTTDIIYKSSVYYDNTGDDDLSDLPFAMQTVSEVSQGDALGSVYRTAYSYADGLYASAERETRGFGYVKVTDAEGNISENWFHQDNIFKGLQYRARMSDSLSKLYVETEKTYNYTTPYSGCTFAYLTEEKASNFEGQINPKITKTTYEYDAYGNPTKVSSLGDVDIIGDEKTLFTEYTYNASGWLLSAPKHTYLLNAALNTVSEKWVYYDGNTGIDDPPVRGLLTREEVWLDTTGGRITKNYSYDEYGNLITVTDPRGRITTTQYDVQLHIFPETVTNHLGHTVRSTYDVKTGQVLTSTDPNNQTSRNEYDVFGRVVKTFGPNDDALHPATWYEYDLSTMPARITTYTREEYNTDDANRIRTAYAFIDGLGRTIQTKTEADDPAQQIVSGVVNFDSRGQVRNKYLPYVTNKTNAYTSPDYGQPSATYEYDPLGRIIEQINTDYTYRTVEYYPGLIITTDEDGHSIRKYQDAYNQTIKIEELNHGRIYTTTYEYDALGNLLRTIDDHGNVTAISYDSLGRKLSMNDPDMGVWQYGYDDNGNLILQTDAKGQTIEFEYDELNRLTRKFSGSLTLVTYFYDSHPDTQDTTNYIGRLSKVAYSSGSTEFFYDNLGREIRSVKTIEGQTYTVERTYDALNRLTSLKYPDGEVVNYTYSASGGIRTAAGNETYVSDVNYTASGQMSFVSYGNNTFTNYTYDPLNLRLKELKTNDGALQDLRYQFDDVGNITTITDNRYTATQSFAYDDLNRLVSAIGQSYGTKTYKYDSIGNILEKDGKTYTYGENGAGPHAVTSLTDAQGVISINYDANGNMLAKNSQGFEYDMENRLTKVSGLPKTPVDATFDLTLQPGWNFISLPLTPQNSQISAVLSSIQFGPDYDQVSRYNPVTGGFDNYNNTSYNQFDTLEFGRGYFVYIKNPSGVTLTINGTLNSQSVAYNLKQGWNLIGTPSNSPIKVSDALSSLIFDTDYNRIARYNPITKVYEDLTQSDNLEPGKAYFIYCLRDAIWNIQPANEITTFTYDGDGGRVKKATSTGATTYVGSLYEVDSDGAIRKHIFMGSSRICTVNNKQSTVSYNYYHSDHLGSSTVITDQSGQLVQHLEYLPYGRTQVSTGKDVANYKFTGKELDASTGLYYYSARYYDPELGKFIQPDSLVQSPYNPQTLNRYAYCGNNPIKYVDPNGQFFGIIIAAIIGAVLGGVSAAVNDQPIWKGVLMGAAGGALTAAGGSFFGFLGAAGGGLMSGAANAAAFGGNIGIGALTGGLAAGLGYGLGSWTSGWNSGSFWGGLGAATISGSVGGGLAAELSGGNFGEGAWMGAAYASAGYLGASGLNELNPRYKNAKSYEQAVKEARALNVKKGDNIKLTVISRKVFGPAGHRSFGWEMGPKSFGSCSSCIRTTLTVEDLSSWPTYQHTQSNMGLGTFRAATTEVSASGLFESIALYETYWSRGMDYNAFSYNSNYAVNSVIYGAGGNVPGGLGYTPAFSTTPYIPTIFNEE